MRVGPLFFVALVSTVMMATLPVACSAEDVKLAPATDGGSDTGATKETEHPGPVDPGPSSDSGPPTDSASNKDSTPKGDGGPTPCPTGTNKDTCIKCCEVAYPMQFFDYTIATYPDGGSLCTCKPN
jgi:hypothetical protein